MKLYRLEVVHYGPKSSHTATEAWLIADSEEKVVAWVCKERIVSWDDPDWIAEEGHIEPYPATWWDENPDAVARAKAAGLCVVLCDWGDRKGQPESVRGSNHNLLRWWRGDFEEAEDAYYGVTHYRWDAGLDIEPSHDALLVSLGIAVQL